MAGTSLIAVSYQKLVRRHGSTIISKAEHGRITFTIAGHTATPGATPTRRLTSVQSTMPGETDEPREIMPPSHAPSSTAVFGTRMPAPPAYPRPSLESRVLLAVSPVSRRGVAGRASPVPLLPKQPANRAKPNCQAWQRMWNTARAAGRRVGAVML